MAVKISDDFSDGSSVSGYICRQELYAKRHQRALVVEKVEPLSCWRTSVAPLKGRKSFVVTGCTTRA